MVCRVLPRPISSAQVGVVGAGVVGRSGGGSSRGSICEQQHAEQRRGAPWHQWLKSVCSTHLPGLR